MPQFDGGSSHVATVVVTNPTGLALSYIGQLYLGIDAVAMSEVSFSLAAGESRPISFILVMPSAAGSYYVFLDVFSGGELLVHHLATESVIIEAVSTVPFVFGAVSGRILSCAPPVGSSSWNTVDFYCTIVNMGSVVATHEIHWMWTYPGTYDHEFNINDGIGLVPFSLTLQPGESYDFRWVGVEHGPSDGCDPVLTTNRSFSLWLQDEFGNQSGRV